MIRIGIDCGGTFTDIVLLEEQRVSVHKIPSSPSDPLQSVLKGIQRFTKDGQECQLKVGAGVPAALTKQEYPPCLLVTNMGFEDLIEIGREARQNSYRLSPASMPQLIERKNRVGIKERTAADGKQILPLDQKELSRIKAQVKKASPAAVAVCLLHSYANPDSEIQVKACLAGLDIPVFLSHEILPELHEYERTCATVVNAVIHGELNRFISSLEGLENPSITSLELMQANGGVTTREIAAQEAVKTINAGPAGGTVAAFKVGKQSGHTKIAAFELGGTSGGISFCRDMVPVTSRRRLNDLPLPVQSVDVRPISPGTGMKAWIDEEGLLRVGPESTGIEPGPICYGRGEEVTLCDAHVFLGRIDPDNFLGGEMILQTEKLSAALEKLSAEMESRGKHKAGAEEIAEGIIRIANGDIAKKIRQAAQEKGCTIDEMTLVPWGGAGPLHACEIAESLNISKIIVPPHPGVLSARGILEADLIDDRGRTVMLSSELPKVSSTIVKHFKELKNIIREKLQKDNSGNGKIDFEEFVDIRYPGQSSEIRVPYSRNFIQAFHAQHKSIYGHSDPSLPVEIVTVRVRGRIRTPSDGSSGQKGKSSNPPERALIQERSVFIGGKHLATPYFLRSLLSPGNIIKGPAIIMEYSSTTLIPDGFKGEIDQWGNIVINRE